MTTTTRDILACMAVLCSKWSTKSEEKCVQNSQFFKGLGHWDGLIGWQYHYYDFYCIFNGFPKQIFDFAM